MNQDFQNILIQETFSADLENVNSFASHIRSSISNLDKVSAFAVELLAREAMINAVVHGCKSDLTKSIQCKIDISKKRALIRIDDEGFGFDWESKYANSRESDKKQGFAIYKKYASKVIFNREGNSVLLIKDLPLARAQNLKMRNIDNTVKITLTPGDLLSGDMKMLDAKIDKFIKSGIKNLDLDLSMTVMIDSSGLSMLLRWDHAFKDKGGSLRIINGHAEILNLLRAINLDKILNIV